jgi:hypothetical protein
MLSRMLSGRCSPKTLFANVFICHSLPPQSLLFTIDSQNFKVEGKV